MEQSYNIIVYNVGMFDVESAVGKMPRFIWSKYPRDKHNLISFHLVDIRI